MLACAVANCIVCRGVIAAEPSPTPGGHSIGGEPARNLSAKERNLCAMRTELLRLEYLWLPLHTPRAEGGSYAPAGQDSLRDGVSDKSTTASLRHAVGARARGSGTDRLWTLDRRHLGRPLPEPPRRPHPHPEHPSQDGGPDARSRRGRGYLRRSDRTGPGRPTLRRGR